MSLSPAGLIDRASSEISRCIMRIKKKKDGGGGGSGGSNNVSTSTSTSSSSTMTTTTTSTSPGSPSHHSSSGVKGPGGGSTGGALGINATASQIQAYFSSPHKSAHFNHHHHQQQQQSPHYSSSTAAAAATGGGGSCNSTPTRTLKFNSSNSCHSQQSQFNNNGQQVFRIFSNGHGPGSGPGGGANKNLMMDSQFLSYLFKNYFHGVEKLVLPLVCKFWRDTSYNLGKEFWDTQLLPVLNYKLQREPIVLNCKIRHELLNCAGVRRRFYTALHKRGFTGLKLLGATDDDAEDVLIHFSQGSNLIHTLKLYNSSLTDKGLYSLLDHLSSVVHLELVSCNEITEDGITKALPSRLTTIVILDCIHVADVVFSALAKHEKLNSFTIQAYHVTDSALSSFNSKINSNLTILKLNSCWELTNQALLHIVSSLPHLEELSLSGCSKVTDEGVEILAENLTVLKSLDLSWCSRITDSALESIACDLVSLEQLILDRIPGVTDMGIGYLATMSSLFLLSIRWCSSIREQSIHHIISIKKLQHLSIAGCTSISPGTLCSLSSLRELRELELTNCGVTPSVIQFLRNTLPHCLVIE